MTRRDWLSLVSSAAGTAAAARVFAQEPDNAARKRIEEIIGAFGEQGIHRTGTDVDNKSAQWLAREVMKCGLKPSSERFNINRVDLVETHLMAGGRRIEGLPLFDGGFTDANGVSGRLGPVKSDAPIILAELVPNAVFDHGGHTGTGQSTPPRAMVIVTKGGRPGLCPSNSPSFTHAFGPPILQVSSEESAALIELARSGAEVTVVAQVKRKTAMAINVVANIEGADRALPPLIVMTPRSGWWSCESERGGGIACWLEIMRALRDTRPARDVVFVASSGHEIGQLGIEDYVKRRPGVVGKSRAWIHLGANIGAAQDAGTIIQASDDDMEHLLAEQITRTGIVIDRRVPRGTAPGGEAGVIHRGGGRYLSVIGRNALFHNPADRGPESIDSDAIARFAAGFISIAQTLAAA